MMLEFTRLPPRAGERPKRKRNPVKTPKIPKVRAVALKAPKRPQRLSCSGTELHEELNIAAQGFKWVSPQFFGSSGRREQLFPGQQKKKCLKLRKRRTALFALKEREGNVELSSARTRGWSRKGKNMSHDVDVSLYPSIPCVAMSQRKEQVTSSLLVTLPSHPPCPRYPASPSTTSFLVRNEESAHFSHHDRVPQQGTATPRVSNCTDPPVSHSSDDVTYLQDVGQNCPALNEGIILRTSDESSGKSTNPGQLLSCSPSHDGGVKCCNESSSNEAEKKKSPSILEPNPLISLGIFAQVTSKSLEDGGESQLTAVAEAKSVSKSLCRPATSQITKNMSDSCDVDIVTDEMYDLSDLVASMSVEDDQTVSELPNSTSCEMIPSNQCTASHPSNREENNSLSTNSNDVISCENIPPFDTISRCSDTRHDAVLHDDDTRLSSPYKVSMDGSKEAKESSYTETSSNNTFQPSSFSTPFQSSSSKNGISVPMICTERDRQESSTDVQSSIGLCTPTRFSESSFSYRDSHDLDSDSLTRLDTQLASQSQRNVALSTFNVTPHRELTSSPQHRSILKKRNISMVEAGSYSTNTSKRVSKCVTFNLSRDNNITPDDDDSLALASETPEDMWCSLPPSSPDVVVTKLDLCDEKDCSSLQSTVCSVDCSNRVVDSNEETGYDEHDKSGSELLSERCPPLSGNDSEECDNYFDTQRDHSEDVCIFAMETPVHMWESPPTNYVEDTCN